MIMMQDGVRVDCLPYEACCMADEDKRSPLELDCCPERSDECNGNCIYYTESYQE